MTYGRGMSSETRFDRDEVEAAFRNYWKRGAVGEDWDAWCDECFTDDVDYVERVLRRFDAARQPDETFAAWTLRATDEELS